MNDEKLKMALDYAADARKTEISLLWSRSLYFWGFISVMLVAYGAAVKEKQFTLAFVAVCVSFILSLCWTLVNRSSKYWQEVWEWKTENLAQDLLRFKLFTSQDVPVDLSNWWGPKCFSPSKLVMAVSDMVVVT